MSNHLNIQICLYPRFDGGFYFSGPRGPLNRMVRLSLGLIDFRLWWVTGPGNSPQAFQRQREAFAQAAHGEGINK